MRIFTTIMLNVFLSLMFYFALFSNVTVMGERALAFVLWYVIIAMLLVLMANSEKDIVKWSDEKKKEKRQYLIFRKKNEWYVWIFRIWSIGYLVLLVVYEWTATAIGWLTFLFWSEYYFEILEKVLLEVDDE